jgi:hypothetical protein
MIGNEKFLLEQILQKRKYNVVFSLYSYNQQFGTAYQSPLWMFENYNRRFGWLKSRRSPHERPNLARPRRDGPYGRSGTCKSTPIRQSLCKILCNMTRRV